MLSIHGRSSRTSQGVTRRRILQAAGPGLLGLGLAKLLAAQEATPAYPERAKSVIFLFLFGGPSQFETFDVKPDAPSEIRGPFRAIQTRTPGLQVCEHLPRLADVSDKLTVVRTMSHPRSGDRVGAYKTSVF